ncbi:hypothetical protein AEQU1_02733 [Aequorivita sp. CIP111184]|nr:hypothetical protein AEQU1_02733 [Aequorivita sp. CIP111184]
MGKVLLFYRIMKYTRLTKEQFEELSQEFINFLATQSITADEWKKLKTEKPEVAEQELDVFSDLIWEGVLKKVKYLEHISPKQLMLFHITEAFMELIAIKVEDDNIDITTDYGYKWLQQNMHDDTVTLFTSTKAIKDDRNKDIFVLIQQGSVITKGELYNYFSELLSE